MGLFDDIVDVYTGSKTKKQVSSNPSTKPQSPPGQKVSGPHVFQGKRLEQKKPRKVTVGYGTMQVDPGLASAIFQKKYKNKKTGEKITKREADALAQSQFLPGEGGFNVTYPDPIKPIIKKDDKEDKDDKDDKEDISTQIMNRIMRKGDHVSDQFSTTKKMVSNYSTVTDLFDTTKQNSKPSITKGLEKLTIKFVLNIQTPKLSKIYHYNIPTFYR